MLFFFIYLFSVLLLGSFYVGPFSVRVYMTVIMLAFLLVKNLSKSKTQPKRQFILPKNFMWLYFLFIAFSALALLLNGEYQEYDFTKLILANYLNCFVTYFAIDYFITDKSKLKSLFYFIIIFVAFDAVVTVLQFMGNPIGKLIALALTTVSDVRSGIVDDYNVNTSLLLGESVPVGLFGYVFTNSTILATFGILSLGLANVANKALIRYALFGVLFLCFYACFTTQERMAFFMFILVALFIFFTGAEYKRLKLPLIILIAFIILFYLPDILLSDKLGRLTTSDYREDVRGEIWLRAFNFLRENLILGGPVAYSRITDIAPHNFFLNVFIDSGLIGGLIAIYLYLLMTYQAIKEFFSKHSQLLRVTSGAICIYSAVCLFHNSSIATGDTSIFILYALFLKTKMMNYSC